MSTEISALLGSIGKTVNRLFTYIEVAEEEIAKKRKKKGDKVDKSFKILLPSSVLRGKSLELYRAHVREIIARAESDQDTRPGTRAECLAALSDLSLKAPPGQDVNAAFHRLFHGLFPQKQIANPAENKEYTPQGAKTVIEDLQKKLTVKDRIL